jgi:hypothetical protein
MSRVLKGQIVPESAAELEARDQEVLRANRELAAYFKGRRTEREARAALKIIKAFIRDRERTASTRRRPLPAAGPGKGAKRHNGQKSAANRRRPRKRSATPQGRVNRSTHEPDQGASPLNGPRAPDTN